MNEWYEQNAENPYPNKSQKEQVAKVSGITMFQVNTWFANKRNRDNNTRPKKQKKELQIRLLEIFHELAQNAR